MRSSRQLITLAIRTGAALLALTAAAPARELAPEDAGVATLDPERSAGWVWVSDFAGGLGSCRSLLFDAQSGAMLGMLNTGTVPSALEFSPDRREIYSVETYFARGSRGPRTDVVAIYDAATLGLKGEVEIPPKTYAGVPRAARSALLDGGRFLVSYNFNGGQSASVVDLKARRFVGEIETAGCAFVYPTGPLRFFMICGDGSLLDVKLDDQGRARSVVRGPTILEFDRDLVFDHAVRTDGSWAFVSLRGTLVQVAVGSGGALAVRRLGSLADPAEDAREPLHDKPGAGGKHRWQVGGLQPFAVPAGGRELFVLAHQGPRSSYQHGGSDVFVFDLLTARRLRRLTLAKPATSISFTGGPRPLLVAVHEAAMAIEIYEPGDGRPVRSIADAAFAPLFVQRVR